MRISSPEAMRSASSERLEAAFPFIRRPVKLVIQIPCYNEEESLPEVLATLPRSLAGVDVIEWLVIDDGSADRTVEVARAHGVDHIVELPVHMGLARGFAAGLQRAIDVGADIIVNTDADNQYDARDIPLLIAPILKRQAQFVIGDRPIATIAHFSPLKRFLQHLGSSVVRRVSGTRVQDAPSGFRAIAREAALRMTVFDPYTYTLETIIEAGLSGVEITSVPIGVNGETRPSRLIRSKREYIRRSMGSIARTFFVYKPGKTFALLGLAPALLGLALVARWILLTLGGTERAHVPSLVAALGLLLLAVLFGVAGLLGELMAINRRLLKEILYRQRSDGAEARSFARALIDRDRDGD